MFGNISVRNMGVDTATYRCRVGLFVSCRGAGVPFCMSFSLLVKMIGSLAFIRILLVMAGIEPNPGPTEKFIFRYQYLLVKIGTELIRRLFEVKVGKDLAKYLASNPTEEQTLKNLIKAKTITSIQATYLPPKEMKPDYSKFDISLLTCLLRNVCGLKPPRDTVWMNPSHTDTSEEADITRLRLCRNWLMHRDTLVLPEADVDVKWKELSRILIRLNQTCGIAGLSALIDKASKMDTDKELKYRLDQTMKTWDAMDQDVMSKLDLVEKRCADGHDRAVKRMKTVEQGVVTLQQEVTTVQRGLSTVKQEVQQGLSTVHQELSTVQQQVTTVNQGLSSVQQEVQQGLSTVQQEVTTVQQGLSTVHQGLSTVQQEVQQGLSTVQQEMQQGLTTVRQEVTTIQQGLSTVHQGISTVQQEVQQGLSTVQHEMQQGLTTVQQEVTTIQQGLSTVHQGTSTVQQEVQRGLSTVQQDMQQGLSTVQRDIMNPKKIPCEHAKVIQQLITIYQRDCRLLQVSPFIEDDNEDLMSIYQSPTLQHTVYDRDQTKGKQVNIFSYEEIFCKDDKTFKRVYITGDAGVGKTSLCRRMCLLWSKSMSGDYAGNDESTKRDIKFLEKFDFLFHVSLGATDRRDMIMMIVDQLFYTECDDERTNRYKLIKCILDQHDSLIVLDGFDEWTPETSGKNDCKTPKGIESEKCVFLTLCRPYKLENVRLSGNDIDHQIEMSGIHGLSSEHYVIEVVKYMNMKNHDNKNADQFLKEVERCDLYDQLCIPIISSHLIAVWWFNQKLTLFSKAFLYGKILEMLFKRAERKVEFLSLPPSEHKLPNSFSQLNYVNDHVFILKKLCLLSFNTLFKQDGCTSTLIFTKKQLMLPPYLFTTDEMEFLCKIGIISKNRVIGCFEEQKQLLSFVHKSYIEFFGALHVSSFDTCNVIDNVVETWSTLDDVVQHQNFLQFLAGLSGVKLISLLEKIYSLLSDHLNVLRKSSLVNYEKNIYFVRVNVYMKQLRSFQTAVINCFIEVSRSNEPNIDLKLEDFIFDDKSNIDVLKKLLLLSTTSVKSIYADYGKYYNGFDQIKSLQCLHVGRVSYADYVKFIKCMLQNQNTLHTICIEGIMLSYTFSYTDLPVIIMHTVLPELPVSSLHHLTSLCLSFIKMEHSGLHDLVECLSDNVLIENIKLYYVSCDSHQDDDFDCTMTLNLPHHKQLTSLFLYNVNIVCNNVNNSSLKSITLNLISERIGSCYIYVFNCIKYSTLEHLYIDGSHMYMSNYIAVKTLTCAVKTLSYIKSLTLSNMTIRDDLLLHPDVTHVMIGLFRVAMSREYFHCFIERFVNNNSVIEFELQGCKIISVSGETHAVLSEKESMDYMYEYLTSIPTVNITRIHDTRFQFETRICQ